MKRFVLVLLFFAVLGYPQITMAAQVQDRTTPIKIFLDDKELISEVPPIIQNERALVPVRIVSESLGAVVGWEQSTKTVFIDKDGVSILLRIGSNQIVKNGETFEIDVAPVIHNNKTMVPVRFVSEYIGLDVGWDEATRSVLLKSPPPEELEPIDEQTTGEESAVTPVEIGRVTAIKAAGDQITISTTIEKPEASVFYLQDPNRAVIDLVYSKPDDLGQIIPEGNTLIGGIRYSHFNNAPDTTRIVVDLNDKVSVTTEVYGNELMLTFTPYVYKIMLDAGHGGRDPGGIGTTGSYEKEFTLDMVNRISAHLLNWQRAEILFTRTDDSYPTLEDRITMANDARADVFISMHANKYYKSSVRGMETFYSREDSKAFAGYLHNSVLPITGFPNRGLKQADYKVIRHTTMPAALMEIGFLSNPEEEKQLLDSDFRQKVAEGIAVAIAQYLGLPPQEQSDEEVKE